MHLKSIHIKNFRALEEIQVDLDSRVSVVVGPNAIGKTTLLEAIRLVKAVVAPRSTNEPTQALLALGAAVPYNPQKILPTAIARDPKRPVEIRCRYRLEANEIEDLATAMPELATVRRERNCPPVLRKGDSCGFPQAQLISGAPSMPLRCQEFSSLSIEGAF